ncbi:hypothetical protein [Nocardia tengchongensis]|uniref:hypothetical protein n=1 Tax=Nocardia tengchongensis TaxID=2055889 RepID=UPI0036AADB24
MSSNRQVWYQRPDGTATTSHELIRTPTRAIQPSPYFCPNGHVYEPGKMVVSHAACGATGPNGNCRGHLTYTCRLSDDGRICNGVTYIPELGPHCALATDPTQYVQLSHLIIAPEGWIVLPH